MNSLSIIFLLCVVSIAGTSENSESPTVRRHKNKSPQEEVVFAEQGPVAHRLPTDFKSLGSLRELRKNIHEYMQDEDFHNRSRDLMCEGRDKASYGCECGALWCCAGFATVGGALFTRPEIPTTDLYACGPYVCLSVLGVLVASRGMKMVALSWEDEDKVELLAEQRARHKID